MDIEKEITSQCKPVALTANGRQVAGQHYQSPIQHWDYVIANEMCYFQAQITKYVTRFRKKNGIQDLEKAQHFLEKLLELERAKLEADDFYTQQDRMQSMRSTGA